MSQCGESCYEVAIVIVKMQLNASAHARYVLDVSVDRVNFKLDFQNVSKELLGDSRGSKEVQGDPKGLRWTSWAYQGFKGAPGLSQRVKENVWGVQGGQQGR